MMDAVVTPSPFILFYFTSHQTGIQSQKPPNSICRFPSRPCTFPPFPTKITPLSILPHLHACSTILLLSVCLISPNPFLLGFIEAFITFHIKGRGVFPLLFVMLPIYGRELAQFPISLLFFPDSHISMSLLGLSLPSQWILSSEDQALERQRAPAAPTSPHPSLYPSLSPHSSFSLHSTLGLTWFWFGQQPRLWWWWHLGERFIYYYFFFSFTSKPLISGFVCEICQQYMWLGSFSC